MPLLTARALPSLRQHLVHDVTPELQYGRRERPHLLLDERRRPTHLLSAVQYGAALPADFSFTHVQAVRHS